MPEGDSIARNAARLRPVLERREIVTVYGTAASVRRRSGQVLGSSVEAVRTHGKNLLVDFSSELTLRVHLGMSGRWKVLPATWRVPGEARVALTTVSHHAVCLGAPTVELDRTKVIEHELAHLGPDLLGPDFDAAEAVARLRTRGGASIAEAILDQRVVAGIGNVYKSELLFIAGINPRARVSEVADSALMELLETARRLLRENSRAGPRRTTRRQSGPATWVYGRARQPCLRCGAEITSFGQAGRVTFWCPGCQPPPPGSGTTPPSPPQAQGGLGTV